MHFWCLKGIPCFIVQGGARGLESGSEAEYSEVYSVLQESGREYTSVETRARDLVQGGFIPSHTYPQYVSTISL